MTKAFAYLRVSGKGQVDGDGFPRQRVAINGYAKRHDIRVVETFTEKGLTGKTEWEDRPAWSEMIAKLNGVRTIVIERLDRLARDLMVQEHILADLKRRDIELISTEEPDLGSDDPSRVLMRQIMGAIAQYDRAMVVNKLRGARKRTKAATGRCEGRKPYGMLNAEEHCTLAEMRVMRAEGVTFAGIAEALNTRMAKPTRYGKAWSPQLVCKILGRVK